MTRSIAGDRSLHASWRGQASPLGRSSLSLTYRSTEDQPLTYEALATRYGWSTKSWEDKFVFVSAAGVRQPIDYHAIRYHHDTKKWGYVAHFKPKESDGSYKEDTTAGESAESDPDTYFGSSQKLVSIACYR